MEQGNDLFEGLGTAMDVRPVNVRYIVGGHEEAGGSVLFRQLERVERGVQDAMGG